MTNVYYISYTFVIGIKKYSNYNMGNEVEELTRCKQLEALVDTIYVIGGKWKMPIIFAICTGANRRFREIERTVGITSRMLSLELKEMEMNKLVTRTVYPDTPVRIEYEITDYCKTLIPVIQAMIDWGTLHRQKVRED